MISLTEIQKYYGEGERTLKRNVRREYVQYRILQAIFAEPLSTKLCFIGGTALRIVYGSSRFSEDLDFDNTDMTFEEFEILTNNVRNRLIADGYTVEVTYASKGAYHCYFKISGILFEQGVSAHDNEKLMIQVDTMPKTYAYTPVRPLINKFDVFTEISAAPASILLSQKIVAVFERTRPQGRDLFDIVTLFGSTTPDYGYIKDKLNISSASELKERLRTHTAQFDLEHMARDVKAFLYNPEDELKITKFREYIEQKL
jgi:predicted nucleotidyltransferase component of viral defense system